MPFSTAVAGGGLSLMQSLFLCDYFEPPLCGYLMLQRLRLLEGLESNNQHYEPAGITWLPHPARLGVEFSFSSESILKLDGGKTVQGSLKRHTQ